MSVTIGLASGPMHTSSQRDGYKESHDFQDYEVFSSKLPPTTAGPGFQTCHYYSASSITLSPEPLEPSHPRFLPYPWKQARTPEPLQPISYEKYPQSHDLGYSAQHHASASSSISPSHSSDSHAMGSCTSSIVGALPDDTARLPTHKDLYTFPYNDFVLYPGRNEPTEDQCVNHHSNSNRVTRSSRPPGAPCIERLATPELREGNISGRPKDWDILSYNYAWRSKHQCDEEVMEWLPPAREGMFPDLY